uniref:Uncharacterized protein n=1 Tax=Arundo donax TaxID=35708 RepID=A0A0A8YEJ4_ARUDO
MIEKKTLLHQKVAKAQMFEKYISTEANWLKSESTTHLTTSIT